MFERFAVSLKAELLAPAKAVCVQTLRLVQPVEVKTTRRPPWGDADALAAGEESECDGLDSMADVSATGKRSCPADELNSAGARVEDAPAAAGSAGGTAVQAAVACAGAAAPGVPVGGAAAGRKLGEGRTDEVAFGPARHVKPRAAGPFPDKGPSNEDVQAATDRAREAVASGDASQIGASASELMSTLTAVGGTAHPVFVAAGSGCGPRRHDLV